MNQITRIFSREEGLIRVYLDEADRFTFTFETTGLSSVFRKSTSSELIKSLAISEFLAIMRHISERDIAIVPIPQHFIFIEREYIYGAAVEKLFIGSGYLYSYQNQLVYISNEFKRMYTKEFPKTPFDATGVTVLYVRKGSIYVIRDKSGGHYHVPYWILEGDEYRNNPLQYLPPFRVQLDVNESKLKFEEVTNTPLKIATVTRIIGVSTTLYIKDEFGTIYSTHIYYPQLRNMSWFAKHDKLVRGLRELSPHGNYLMYIQDILKHMGIIYE